MSRNLEDVPGGDAAGEFDQPAIDGLEIPMGIPTGYRIGVPENST